ncbi:nitroreductase family protein [Salidesulfovibrio onnuriiensis]|uniref:nitroreductase family protein n=1 Tax=Salidesulfovibrio onnuriiensis TaxID=2583823 RepID=UPI0011CB3C2B|nr:nitroreductase family protein [Salidesulfovibrio onnuriiensis]
MLEFKVDQEKCVTCGECISDCPILVLKFDGAGFPVVAEGKESVCIRCQHCMAVCPTGALSILGKNPEDSLSLENLPDGDQMERLMKGRRSVRRYKKDPVAPATLDKLMDVITSAPTGKNTLSMTYTLVDDPAVMDKLREATYNAIFKAVEEDNLPPGMDMFQQFAELWRDKGVDVIFRSAPHFLIASTPADGPSPEADCLIGLSYFELLAQSMGLGTLWDGLAKWAISLIAPDLLLRIGIPEDHVVGYMMVFGKPAVKYHRTVQRQGSAVINRVSL